MKFALPRIPRVVLIPMIVACALFMENMDSTVIATSLPDIARDLGEDPISLKLALTSYLLSLAVFIPISDWMADRFGARTVFRGSMIVFMLGSVLCAFSDSLAGFVAARFLQDIGGAMMVPVGRLVVLRSTTKAEMVRAMSYLTIPALLGPVIGPPLGGFISTWFHWRWIFFINVPICIVGLILAGIYIENTKAEESPALDVPGFLLSAISLSLLMMGLATYGRGLLPVSVSLGAMLIGAMLLALHIRHALHREHPILNLRLFCLPTFRAGAWPAATSSASASAPFPSCCPC
ncbi:MFS transporter [Candidatus Dactylopiibacterium carminicum]|uniref:MFS transporter n=1 Tax=Candidatus Dactylopiibacterium carminicum TaxID=857335 RepID=UPI001CC2C4F8|nr:MFS transporter [Candidatus Dactylopiibacterium carminicum]